MVIVMVVCQPPLHNHRRNQVQMKLDTNSLAHTKWECKYHILIVCQLVHLLVGNVGSFFQIFLFHIPINKNMPQLRITNSHFKSPLWAIWCRVQ